MTNRVRTRIGVSSIILAFAALAGLAYHAGAGSVFARPTSVGTVNLAKVLEGLQQRADAEVGLQTMTDQIKQEQETREGELEAMRTRLQQAAAGGGTGAALIGVEEELALKMLNYQAWQQFAMNKLDIERALLMQELYRTINEAIEEMAETEGYDLVLVDDSQGALDWSNESKVSREAQILQKIASRRVLYASPAIDATDDLVARMNNKYRAGNP